MNSEEFKTRSYAKKELAYIYFPDAKDPHVAVNHLISWIKRCKPLYKELEEMGYIKTSKYFSPREVKAIVKHLGEP